jgi:PAS domain S-box-containing protein
MNAADSIAELARDPRFSPYATSAIPAWGWAGDGQRLIWANASGAVVFGAASPAELAGRTFAPDDPILAEVARVAVTLPENGAPRLGQFKVGNEALTCTCSRVSIGDGYAILILGSDPLRPALPLAQRVERLFAPASAAVAVFAPDGALIYATGDLDADTTLATLGAEGLKETAINSGTATGVSALGPLTLTRLGRGGTTVLVASLPDASGLSADAAALADTHGAGADQAVTNDVPSERPAEPPAEAALSAPPDGAAEDATLTAHVPAPSAPAEEPAPQPPHGPEPSDASRLEPPSAEPRPLLSVVPPAKNVVPFRGSQPPDKRPALTPVERKAFHEIAETLGKAAPSTIAPPATETPAAAEPTVPSAPPQSPEPPAQQDFPARQEVPAQQDAPVTLPSAFAHGAPAERKGDGDQLAALERLPVAVLIHRGEELLYANRAFLEWTGYADLAAVVAAGGLERLVVDPSAGALDKVNGTGKTFTLAARNGTLTCEGRHSTVPWQGESALMLVLIRTAADDRLRDAEIALRGADAEVRELKAILDTATDGIIVVDRDGLILTFNRSAEALFGYDYAEIARRPFTELFAPESERAARDYLDGLTSSGVASVLNDGREVIGRVRQGGLIPLFMTMGRIGDSMPKFCAVLRDITQWKRAEEDLLNAKRTAERASSAKSEFLAKISHEIRTPLNAIIGFSEVMIAEQFGPIGSERYREYLRDIHSSGEHLVSLINDLLDLSKIEAGKLDLVFASVNLNTLVQQCVALMQPQANQSRIIIRSSLSPTLPPVVADARSVRQIVLNLLSNSIKFTGPGGQVIVSTALTDRAEAVLRVRDTGVGMTDKEIETAMEPFRQLATSTRWGSGGTGLGLPLTKALAEANRAAFTIKSARDAGTLVEITFPGTRVLAE